MAPVMLTAKPKNWYSWNFSLQEPNGSRVAELHLSAWRERGSANVGGAAYDIRRKGFLGPFIMEAPDGSTVASAIKPSALWREFVVTQRGQRYVLKAMAALRREFGLFLNDHRIGSITPDSLLRRRASVEFPDANEVSPLLEAFVVWLTLLLWKRDSDAGAA